MRKKRLAGERTSNTEYLLLTVVCSETKAVGGNMKEQRGTGVYPDLGIFQISPLGHLSYLCSYIPQTQLKEELIWT